MARLKRDRHGRFLPRRGRKRPRARSRRRNPAAGFLGVPLWGWLVGAAAVYFLFLRKSAAAPSLLTAPTPTLTTNLPGMQPQLNVPGLTPGTDFEGYGRYGRF